MLSMCACEMSISAVGAVDVGHPHEDRHRQLRAPARASPASIAWSPVGQIQHALFTIMPRMQSTTLVAAARGRRPAPPGLRRSAQRAAPPSITILKPARVFDGDGDARGLGGARQGRSHRRRRTGGDASRPRARQVIDLPGTTLTPGLIEGHSHILLHAYSETSWTDQVSREGLALRVARATNHLRATLQAGFTTVRDLGTEGAGYADVELKQAVNQGIIPGPRILASTRAIVATGSYAPKFVARVDGAAGRGRSRRRRQPHARRARPDRQGRRLDQDVRRLPLGPAAGSRPTFSIEEMKLAVETAKSAGVPVAVHANTAEGMRRATLAGVETIEHGGDGTPEIFKLMAEHHVALCPTHHRRRRRRWPPADPELAGERRASGPASRRRSPPASRSSAAATSACSPTARTRASSRRWWLRHDAGGRAEERDLGGRARAAHGEPDRLGEGRACSPTWSPSTATRRRTSRRCGGSGS